MKKLLNTPLVLMIMAIGMYVSSCKPYVDPSAELIFEDIDEAAVADATVKVYCVNEDACRDEVLIEDVTDSEGKIKFTVDLPAVLKVESTKTFSYTHTFADSTTKDSTYNMVGEKFVKLEWDKVTKETITMYGSKPQ